TLPFDPSAILESMDALGENRLAPEDNRDARPPHFSTNDHEQRWQQGIGNVLIGLGNNGLRTG
ncbi:MAG: hypothetical protein ACI9SE_004812, partial [Neolewinella sp.]